VNTLERAIDGTIADFAIFDMTKPGEKQKKKPKLKDKKQSERFKEMAREVGADGSATDFDNIVTRLARTKPEKRE
jgi:hypothetical protein